MSCWTLLQAPGEAVLVPAGAPHQVLPQWARGSAVSSECHKNNSIVIQHSSACYIFVPLKTWRARPGRKPHSHCREEKLSSLELGAGSSDASVACAISGIPLAWF